MQGLLAVSVFAIGLSFAVLSLAGGRNFVGVLSGTMPRTATQALLGLGYAVSWFAAVLIAPVLVAVLAATRLRAVR
jgi:hypothetical protein